MIFAGQKDLFSETPQRQGGGSRGGTPSGLGADGGITSVVGTPLSGNKRSVSDYKAIAARADAEIAALQSAALRRQSDAKKEAGALKRRADEVRCVRISYV